MCLPFGLADGIVVPLTVRLVAVWRRRSSNQPLFAQGAAGFGDHPYDLPPFQPALEELLFDADSLHQRRRRIAVVVVTVMATG